LADQFILNVATPDVNLVNAKAGNDVLGGMATFWSLTA